MHVGTGAVSVLLWYTLRRCGARASQGEREIPNPPALYNLVTDFGATPDDERPDTAAFQAAFTRVPAGGVLFIPPGRFIVDQ